MDLAKENKGEAVPTLLTVTDSKKSKVRLEVENDLLRIQTKSPFPEYKEPAPHITTDNAREMVVAIERFTGAKAVEDPSLLDKTDRGFTIYGSFIDNAGNEIRVQESSACPVIYAWVFCQTPDDLRCEPLLNRGQALRLAAFLMAFIHDKTWHSESGECPICP